MIGRSSRNAAPLPFRSMSHRCYNAPMAKVITQRTLRNESGEIMRGLDRGESFIVTRNGVPVGELMPVRRRMFVRAGLLIAALAGAPSIDAARFRRDVDTLIAESATACLNGARRADSSTPPSLSIHRQRARCHRRPASPRSRWLSSRLGFTRHRILASALCAKSDFSVSKPL